MTEPQDFESLDELFRKTFDSLPETPSKSGWDRPSERVWQHVQATVQPPQSGWSAKAVTLVSALVVTVAIGLYLFVIRPGQSDEINTKAAETAVVAAPPATAPPTPAIVETVATPPAPEKVVEPKRTVIRQVQRLQKPALTPPDPGTAKPPVSQRPSGSIPLPGSTGAPPNNTIENLEKLWRTPLQTLPVLPERIDRPDNKDLKKN